MAIENIAIEIKSNAKKIENQLSAIDAQIKKLKNEKPQIELKAEKLETAKKRIDSINLQLKELSAKKADIKANTKDVDEAKRKIAEVNERMNKLRSVKANLQVTTERLKGADKDLKNLNKEMQQLNNKKAKLQVDADGINQSESKLGQLRNQLQNLGTSRTKIDISTNVEKVGSQLDSIGSKLLNLFNPLTSQLNQLIGIGAALKLINGAVNMVKSSIDGAITRTDVLNNFPKTMSNLKISAEDSQKAIDTLGDKLTGLPPTLNDAALSVQRFTSKNEDIGKSTNMFLALNNAILAGGASTDIQSSALEQLSQAYSKGSIDMMEWRTALMAMPAQMSQIAKSFGMTSDELGESLRNGDKSMDEFFDRVMEMNEAGIEGFQSFADQAKNAVGGIRTSIKTMGSAITRGVTKNIAAVNNILENAGFGGITGVLSSIGKAFESTLGQISVVIENNQDKIIGFAKVVQEKFAILQRYLHSFDWRAFGAGIKEGFVSLASAGKGLLGVLKPVVDIAKSLITKFGGGSLEKGLGKLIPLLLKTAIASKVLGKSFKVLSKIKLPSFSFGRSNPNSSGGGLTGLTSTLTSVAKQGANLALVFGTIKVLEELAEALKQINDKVPSDLGALQPKLLAMAEAIVGMGVVVFAAGKLPTGVMAKGLALVAGIAGDLILTAKALGDIDKKVSSNLGDLQPKLLAMGEALAAMGVFALAAGALASTGFGGIALLLGEFVTAGLAANLILTAKALGDIDKKVPTNVKNVQKKLEVMREALQSVASESMVSAFKVVNNLAGAIDAIALATTLEMYATTGKLFNKIAKIKIDPSAVRSVIRDMQSVMEELSTSSGLFGKAGKLLFGGNVDTGTAKKAKKAVNNLIELSETLESFSSVETPDLASVKSKISDLQKVFKYLQESNGLFTNVDNFFEGGNIDTKIAKKAKKAIDNLVTFAKSLTKLPEINTSEVRKKIKSVQLLFKVLETTKGFNWNLGAFFAGGEIDTKISQTAKEAIDNLVDFAQSLVSIPVVDATTVSKKIRSIQRLFEVMRTTDGLLGDLGGFFFGGDIDIDIAKEAQSYIASLNDVVSALDGLPENFDKTAVSEKITDIQDVFESFLKQGNLLDRIGTFFMGGEIDTEVVKKAKEYIDKVVEIAEEMGKLTSVDGNNKINVEAIEQAITDIQSVFDLFEKDKNILAKGWGVISGNGSIDTSAIDQISESVKILNKITENKVDYAAIEEQLNQMKDALEIIAKFEIPSTKSELDLSGYKSLLDELEPVGQLLSSFKEIKVDYNSISELLRQMKWALTTIGNFELDALDKKLDLKLYDDRIKGLKETIDLMQPLTAVPVDYNAISEQLRDMKRALTTIAELDLTEVGGKVDAQSYIKRINNIQSILDVLVPLNELDISFDNINQALHQFGMALSSVKNLKLPEFSKDFSSKNDSEKFSAYLERIESVREIVDKLNEFSGEMLDEESFNALVDSVSRMINKISQFAQQQKEIKEIPFAQLVDEFRNLLTQIDSLGPNFEVKGGDIASWIIQGFKAKNVPTALVSVINNAAAKLRAKSETFKKIGQTYGDKLKTGFTTAVKNMSKALEPEVSVLNNYTNRFGLIGAAFGTSLSQKFGLAISGMSAEINKQVIQIQKILDNLKMPTLSTSTGRRNTTQTLSSGGSVNYLASGGLADLFKRKGTDSVPAMLTPGEYVQRKAAVHTFGVDFMDRVNNLDIQGAFQAMTNRFGLSTMLTPAVATTVNNITTTNTNNARVVQNINSDSQNYNGYKKLNRFVRNL